MSAFPSGTRPDAGSRSIDVNADLGEGFPNDKALLERVTSASICCGAHAGSPEVIRETLKEASALRVAVGAHPGYDDRQGFGRRNQNLPQSELLTLLERQLDLLIGLAGEIGVPVVFLKPHGALYNQAQREPDIATVIARAAATYHLPLLGQPASVMEATARVQNVPYFAEGFPDRRYRPDGSLVPRTEPDAILSDPGEIEDQVLRLVSDNSVATLCIHGDDPRAVANAVLVREILDRNTIAVRPFLAGPA